MKIKKKAVALAVAVVATLGGLSVGSSPASAAVDGTVECFSGGDVVGMWVEVTSGSGTSGWATLTPLGGGQWDWYRNIPSGSSYYVSVGCGGSGSNWANTTYGPTVSGNHSWLCFPGYSGIAGGFDRCISA